MDAAVCILQRLPILAPSWMTAPGPIQQSSPMTTSPAMYANGSTVTLFPIFASGWTYANGLIMVVLFLLLVLYNLCHYERLAHERLPDEGLA